MSPSPESPLKKPKLTIVTLNKKLIIVVAAVLLLAILGIMISALSPNTLRSGSSHNGVTGQAKTTNPPADLSSLPGSYSQGDQISQIMARGNPSSRQDEAQLNALKSAQQSLQAQLAALKGQGMGNQDPMASQAMTSSIFFAGGAPQPASSQNEIGTNSSAAEKAAAKNGLGQSSENSYQQQNMQGQKLDFLTSKPNKNIYNNNTIQYPASQFIVQAGSVIPAILQTKLISNLPGVVTALVSQDVYDSISGKYLLIPRGSKLIGEYNSTVSYGQNQLQVKFTRLIRPDGSSIILPNQPGVNTMGSTGIEDEVDNHWGRVIGAAALSAIFNLPAIVATNELNTNSNSVTCNGGVCTGGSNGAGQVVGASALQSAGQSAANVGNQVAQNALNIQPTIVINSGYQFSVMVTKDIILPPYGSN